MGWVRCGLGTPSEVLSLPTPSEASGAIARFNTDLTENLMSAVAEFSASQASGTPTPSAPIPIVGVDKVNLTDCGKNIMDMNYLTATGITVTSGEAVGTASSFNAAFGTGATGLKDKMIFKPNTQYTISVQAYNEGNTSTTGNGLWFIIYYTDETYTRLQFANTDTSYSLKTVTSNGNKTIDYIAVTYGSTGSNIWHVKEFQVEQNTEATAYEAYNGITALINLGGTYYGGSVDAVTGKKTKTWNYINLGDLEWFYNSTNGYFYNLTNIMPKSGTKNWLCTTRYLKPDSVAWSAMEDGMAGFGGIQFRVKDSSTTSSAQFKQNINGTYLAYELETPETVYASNTAEIPTIVGDNQVFADSGNIAVKFLETVGHKI